MKSNRIVLLRTLLLSTSQWNKYKHTKDRKQRGKIIGVFAGMAILYAVIIGYCILMCVGYGKIGMAEVIPTLCALTISTLAFLFTIFKTNGYLFNFKEYDLLMALPFEARTVAADKFLYMYVKCFPWYFSISLAMMIGYGMYVAPGFYVYIVWVCLSILLPIIPMLFASFIGFLIAKVSVRFRQKNIIQTILLFAFVLLCFSSQFIIDALVKNNQVEATLEQISTMTDGIGRFYPPVQWFSAAVTKLGISDMLLLVGVTILLFEAVFFFVGKSYRRINSALMSHGPSKVYRKTICRKRSVWNTIAYKEFKRMTGSANYMVNCGLGEVLSFVLGVVVLFTGVDKVIAVITNGAPVSKEMLYPAFPLIVYFLIGMVATTACSPSLEGKNYWIVQSLPLDRKTLYQGKMLFNLYLTVPFAVFATLCLCISANVPLLNTMLYLIEIVVLCAFSTAWGCVCGIRHMKLDWENELEVIKQGAAVAIYLFPNMFVTMGLVVLVVYLGMRMNSNLVTVILIAIVAVLALLSYRKVLSLAKKK